MNCPGQGRIRTNADLFFFTLFNQPMWLDVYNANAGHTGNTVPYNSQYKCYDGMHNWNQVQPAPYDGYYTFPSVTSIDSSDRKVYRHELHACVPNPDTTDSFRFGQTHAACGQVCGGNDRSAGIRTGEGRRQEHPDRR